MKSFLRFCCALALLCLITKSNVAQCTIGLNGPFPIPQYNQYNCVSGTCNSPQIIPAPWQPGDFWELQVPDLLLLTDYFIDFGVDPNALPFGPNLEITLFDANTFDIITHVAGGLQLVFQLPYPGTFHLTISDIGQCGVPPVIGPFNGFAIDASCPLFCPLTRFEAHQILLADPLLAYDPGFEIMMCPPDDFGFGPSFEGLLPPGTLFGPGIDLLVELPPPPFEVVNPSYLFYQDLFPGQLFMHEVIYYLMDATFVGTPSIANGGIQVIDADWWPFLFLPGTTNPIEPFNSADLYFTPIPPGPFHPEGLSGGAVLPPNFNEEYTDCVALTDKDNNKCALVFSGFGDNRAKNSVKRQTERLNSRDCYDKDNIISMHNATEAQICDTLMHLLNKDTACEELCIYIIAHGIERADGSTRGGFGVNGSIIRPPEWQVKMDSIAKKGIRTHITFETCRATAIGNPFNWGLPRGSSVTFASDATHSAWAYTYKTPTCDTITEGIFSHAIEECRKDTANADYNDDGVVSHKEGVRWVMQSKPCYSKVDTPPVGMRYPAGSLTNPAAYNPGPSMVCIGEHASSFSARFKIPDDGMDTEEVCLVFQGDRRQGTNLVYDSNGDMFVPHTVTKTYNAERNETTICFKRTSGCFVACQRYWFHWYDNTGNRLVLIRSYATACPASSLRQVASSRDIPSLDVQTDLSLDGSQLNISIFNRGEISGGIGEPATIDVRYRIGSDSIPIAELNTGHASYTALPLTSVASGVALDTNEAYTFSLDLPQEILPGQYLFVETDHTWAANGNESNAIHQFSATGTKICHGDITYTMLSTIPDLTNSDGIITLDNVEVTNAQAVFNAGVEINLTPGTLIPLGNESFMYILGCD